MQQMQLYCSALRIYYIKLKSRLSVCLSALFDTLITQLCQHRLKRDLLKMKAVALKITKFILQAHSTHRSSTGVPRRRRCK